MKDYAEVIWSVVGTIVFLCLVLAAGAFIGYGVAAEKFCEQTLGGTYSAGSCFESDSKIDF